MRASGWLAAVLVLAVLLRVDGIGYGLDFVHADRTFFTNDTDARGMVIDLRERFLRGDFHPNTFLVRGPAGFHVFGVVDALAVGAWSCFHPGGWSGVLDELQLNPSLLYLLHRLVSAMAGVLTVLLVFRMVRREFDATSALLAALLLAVGYLHVRDSHLATVDVLSGLATVAAVDRMLALVRRPTRPLHVFSGLLAGAATGVKYFGVLLGIPLVLAHFLARGAAREAGERPPRNVDLALALLACPLGFLLSSPGVLGALPDLVHDLLFDVETLAPTGSTPWKAASVHAEYTLLVGLGELVALLALVGIVPLWRSGRAGRFLVLTLLALAPALFLTRVQNVRYGLPFAVLCTVPAAFLLAQLLGRMPRALRPVVVCAVIAPSLARSFGFDRVLHERDTRAEMLTYLRARGYPPHEVVALGKIGSLPVAESAATRPFVHHRKRRSKRLERSTEQLLAEPPRSILVSLSTPANQIPDWKRIERLLRERYRETLRLEPGPEPFTYERVGTPALMITYAWPWRQTRPGSRLVLYDRVDP